MVLNFVLGSKRRTREGNWRQIRHHVGMETQSTTAGGATQIGKLIGKC